MKLSVKIFVFVTLSIGFYMYIGLIVPQKTIYPPETTDFRSDLTPAELAAAGEDIFAGKGACLVCHAIGTLEAALRYPNLENIGAIAASRIDSLSDVDYLAQSFYEPDLFIVEGFLPGMPPVNRPPIGLTDAEILAVIAYMQSLGGEPTVTLQTRLHYQSDSVQVSLFEEPATLEATRSRTPETVGPRGSRLFTNYFCATCHLVDAPNPTDPGTLPLKGPSLYNVGSRLSRAAIYEAILEPDLTLSEGYEAGIMSSTLIPTGFYDEMSPIELRALVNYLAALTGD